MGPSGAGKTTFLNTISDRNLGKGVEMTAGVVAYNTTPTDKFNVCCVSGFVPQDDILMEVLTPRESLTFSAKLKLDYSTTDEEIA